MSQKTNNFLVCYPTGVLLVMAIVFDIFKFNCCIFPSSALLDALYSDVSTSLSQCLGVCWHFIQCMLSQVNLSKDDLAMIVNETSKASNASGSTAGVDKGTYFSVMENCTLF